MSKTALFQLGMDHQHGSRDHGAVETQTEDFAHEAHDAASAKVISLFSEDRQDHFIERDGVRFAGTHLIVDLMEADGIDDLALMESAMRECVEVAGATLLHIHLHHFTPNDGISGVAVLAESHISVHTWPEVGYAAFDVFMCGDANPRKAVEVLKKRFRPRRVAVSEHMRGSAV